MSDTLYHRHISSKHKLLDLKLGEVWRYRDLIKLFVRRSFTVSYKQTILGPAWILINPLMTSIMHCIVFGNIAKLSTDGIPQLLFYLTSTALWNLFSGCLSSNSSTFVSNAGLFGKVYFPRLTIPISNIISAIIRFFIQMILILGLLIYYVCCGMLTPHWVFWPLLPIILLHLGLMGMGAGIIISSLTTKYRDLSVLVGFGLSLWMYGTPVVYPLSQLAPGLLRTLVIFNPVTAPIELFRWALMGHGSVIPECLVISWVFTAIVLFVGIVIFNRVERTFMDTV